MLFIKPGYEILTPIDGLAELKAIESAARICYKSEAAITEDGESAKKLIRRLIQCGHEAMLEHSFLSVKFTVDRGITHELVRHRLCSFAQESTRYCNYFAEKFGRNVRFIIPYFFTSSDRLEERAIWVKSCENSEKDYFALLEKGATPQEARTVLNHSVAADIVMSGNYREWRHILKLRTAKDAHPQMREVMCPLGEELKRRIPVIFDDCVTKLEEKS